jgi:hypothetical protein
MCTVQLAVGTNCHGWLGQLGSTCAAPPRTRPSRTARPPHRSRYGCCRRRRRRHCASGPGFPPRTRWTFVGAPTGPPTPRASQRRRRPPKLGPPPRGVGAPDPALASPAPPPPPPPPPATAPDTTTVVAAADGAAAARRRCSSSLFRRLMREISAACSRRYASTRTSVARTSTPSHRLKIMSSTVSK